MEGEKAIGSGTKSERFGFVSPVLQKFGGRPLKKLCHMLISLAHFSDNQGKLCGGAPANNFCSLRLKRQRGAPTASNTTQKDKGRPRHWQESSRLCGRHFLSGALLCGAWVAFSSQVKSAVDMDRSLGAEGTCTERHLPLLEQPPSDS